MIPKIIHQTYPTREVPGVLAQSMHRLRDMHPAWQYRFYDDEMIERFISRHYGPRVMAAYRSIADGYGATRADLFRYLVMFKTGGVYLDAKSTVARPLDSILGDDDEYLLAQWPNEPGQRFEGWGLHPDLPEPGGELQQWHVIAAPEHPFLEAVIRAVLRNIETYDAARDGVGPFGALRISGPIAYTRAIRQCAAGSFRHVRNHEDAGLVYSVLESRGKFAHRHVSSGTAESHYSRQTHPIVRRAEGAVVKHAEDRR